MAGTHHRLFRLAGFATLERVAEGKCLRCLERPLDRLYRRAFRLLCMVRRLMIVAHMSL